MPANGEKEIYSQGAVERRQYTAVGTRRYSWNWILSVIYQMEGKNIKLDKLQYGSAVMRYRLQHPNKDLSNTLLRMVLRS